MTRNWPATGNKPDLQAKIDAALRRKYTDRDTGLVRIPIWERDTAIMDKPQNVVTSKLAVKPVIRVLVFQLTEPPSVNTWKNFRRTGGKYFAWKQSALIEVRRQVRYDVQMSGPLFLQMIFAKGRADLDNRIKPILDLLQAAAIIENDRQVELLTAGFGAEKGTCTVAISQLTAAAVR